MFVAAKAQGRNQQWFAAWIEYRRYPIYLSQFHIEKTQFERIRANAHISKEPKIVKFSFDFMMEFVEGTRQYAKPLDELDLLARSYMLTHRKAEKDFWNLFEQCYFFPRSQPDDFTPRTFYEQSLIPRHTAALPN